MKTILFSPIGGTDPISQDNCFDGSMLHICRHRKPDEVYLYLSSEMTDLEESDHRYTEAVKLLGERINHHFEVKLITRPDLVNPHDFNFFFKEFRELIKKLSLSLESDDSLLVNISSGTPGMKSALNVMSTLGEFRCKSIQVTTPEHGLGNHNHSADFDLKTLWELDPDNEENAEDRTSEVECPNLLLIKAEQTIKDFLLKYDYHAAYDMASEISATYSSEVTERYMGYLEFAMNRAAFKNIDSYLNQYPELKDFMPISGPDRSVFEYALLCDLKWKRGELSDFIRSLSPLIQELFLRVVDRSIYPVSQELIEDNRGHAVWNRKRMLELSDEDPKVGRIHKVLKKAYPDFDTSRYGSYVSSDSLCEIVAGCADSAELRDDINRLRNQIERKIRNIIAHQIFYIDENWIKKETGNLTPFQIMKLLKKVFCYTSINVRDEYWYVYDEMNRFIISKIDEA